MAPPLAAPGAPQPPRRARDVLARTAEPADAGPLLQLMRELALFEGYAARFAVTERDLLDRGLSAGATRQFTAIVAEAPAGGIVGYAVIYEIPFTYDLRPTLVLKELYVVDSWRAEGVGSAVMESVLAHARARGCARVKWDVLPDNQRARAFYRRFGGQPDAAWEPWILELADRLP